MSMNQLRNQIEFLHHQKIHVDKGIKSNQTICQRINNISLNQQTRANAVQKDQVSFLVRIEAFARGQQFISTGTLVGPNLVLTCAHSIYPKVKNIGERRQVRQVNIKLTSGKTVQVQQFRYPKQFNQTGNRKYDYALLLLEQNIDLQQYPRLKLNLKKQRPVQLLTIRNKNSFMFVQSQKKTMNLYRNQRYLPSFKTEIADQGCPLIVKENGHTFIIGLYITKYKNYFEPDQQLGLQYLFISDHLQESILNFQNSFQRKGYQIDKKISFYRQNIRQTQNKNQKQTLPPFFDEKYVIYQQGNYGITKQWYRTFLKQPKQYPFNCVCLIESNYNLGQDKKGRIFGVGTLITPSIALTCAHLFFHSFNYGKRQKRRADNVIVYIGGQIIRVTDFKYPKQYQQKGISSNRQYDFALVLLEKEIERNKYPILTQNFVSEKQVNILLQTVREEKSNQNTQMSKETEHNKQFSIVSQMRLMDISNQPIFKHRMNTEKGDSGGPLMHSIGNSDYFFVMAIHVSATYKQLKFVAPVFVTNISVKMTNKVVENLKKLKQELQKNKIWSHLKANTLKWDQLQNQSLKFNIKEAKKLVQYEIPKDLKDIKRQLDTYNPEKTKHDAQQYLSMKEYLKENQTKYQVKPMTEEQSNKLRYLRSRFIMFCDMIQQDDRLNHIKKFLYAWQFPQLLKNSKSKGEPRRILQFMKKAEDSKYSFEWDSLVLRLKSTQLKESINTPIILPQFINSQRQLQNLFKELNFNKKIREVDMKLWKQNLQSIQQDLMYEAQQHKAIECLIPKGKYQSTAYLSKIKGSIQEIQIQFKNSDELSKTYWNMVDSPHQDMIFIVFKRRKKQGQQTKRILSIKFIKLQLYKNVQEYFRELQGGIAQLCNIMKKILKFMNELHNKGFIIGVHLPACMLINVNKNEPIFYYIVQRLQVLKHNVNLMDNAGKMQWQQYYPIKQIQEAYLNNKMEYPASKKIDVCILGKQKIIFPPQWISKDIQNMINSMICNQEDRKLPHELLQKVDEIMIKVEQQYGKILT